MTIAIKPNNFDTTFELDHLPDKCPHCQKSIDPKPIADRLSGVPHEPDCVISVVFYCPDRQCGRSFIADYKRLKSYNCRMRGEFYLKTTHPSTLDTDEMPQAVTELFPLFTDIYWQANKAEKQDLIDIAGPGYRKALEFLLKDYCISKVDTADEKQLIKEMLLGRLINTYVQQDTIKSVAQRAVWLGNDETHYVRKWQDKNLQDLKNLIKLTCNWISNEMEAEKYITDMPR